MWKNAQIVLLLGTLAAELIFLHTDLLRFLSRIGIREVVIVLVIAFTVGLTQAIRSAARRL